MLLFIPLVGAIAAGVPAGDHTLYPVTAPAFNVVGC